MSGVKNHRAWKAFGFPCSFSKHGTQASFDWVSHTMSNTLLRPESPMESSTAELAFFAVAGSKKERVALDFGASTHHPSETWHFHRLRLHQRLRRPSAIVTDIQIFNDCHDDFKSWLNAPQFACKAKVKKVKKQNEKKVRLSRKAGTNGVCWKHLRNRVVASHGLKPCWGSCTKCGSSESTSCLRNLRPREVERRRRQKQKWAYKEPQYHINQCLKVELVQKSNQGNHSPPQLQTLSLLRNGEVLQKTWKRPTGRDRVKSSPHKEWPW